MCLSPTRIRNPNYKSKLNSAYYKDTSSFYINIPCGYCPQCVAYKQSSIVQRVQMEQLEYHIFFCTLTYNNDMIPVISTSSGYDIKYADVHDVQNMMKRIRKYNRFGRPYRYFAVSELGGSRGRPHFHILFFVKKFDGDTYNDCLNLEKVLYDSILLEWRRNVAVRIIQSGKNKGKSVPDSRNPVYKPLCTLVRRFVRGKLRSTYDLHYVRASLESSEADVAFYVTKYMCKPSDRVVRLQRALKLNLEEDEYDSVWSLVRPRWFSSLHFGRNDSADDYVRSCISRSKITSDFPLFYSPADGKSFPLARYYKTHGDLYSMSDYLDFYYKSSDNVDNVVFQDDFDLSRSYVDIEQFNKRKSRMDENDESSIFNELLDYA